MEKQCVIVSAGPVSEALRAQLPAKDSFVIACDAGWKNCRKLQLQPNLVVGDFDSAPRPEMEDVIILPHVKDDTDTQYAAAEAVRRGFRQVLLLGALGGKRMEHTLANLSTGLWLEKHGVRAQLLDEKSRVTYVMPGAEWVYPREGYQYFSVFPMEGRAEGVCIAGAFYPLEDAALEASYPLGVSNEFTAREIRISCQKGALLVVETLAD